MSRRGSRRAALFGRARTSTGGGGTDPVVTTPSLVKTIYVANDNPPSSNPSQLPASTANYPDVAIAQGPWRTTFISAYKAGKPTGLIFAYQNLSQTRAPDSNGNNGCLVSLAECRASGWMMHKADGVTEVANSTFTGLYTVNPTAAYSARAAALAVSKADAASAAVGFKIDGIFLDDFNYNQWGYDSTTGGVGFSEYASKLAAFTALRDNALAAVTSALNAAGYLAVVNANGSEGQYAVYMDTAIPYCDGLFSEYTVLFPGGSNIDPTFITASLASADKCVAANKHYWASNGIGGTLTAQQHRIAWGVTAMMQGPRIYGGLQSVYNDWPITTTTSPWNTVLGQPVSPRTIPVAGVHRRVFENAIVYLNTTASAYTATEGSVPAHDILIVPVGYSGTSVGALGADLSRMWGGLESGSWMTSKLPDNSSVHTDSAAGVQILVNETTGTNYWGAAATPWMNIDTWSATMNVVSASQANVPVYMVGSRAAESWAQPLKWNFENAGVPIPVGLEPTNDSDASLTIYQPDWTSADGTLHGRLFELWVAKSPAQNAADGLTARWTFAWGGVYYGVNDDERGHWYNKDWVSGETNWTTAAARMDQGWGAMATSIPYTNQVITMRDIQRGVIDHPIGFLLDPVNNVDSAGNVWPAQRYDSGSRINCPQGSRFRLPSTYDPGSLTISPLGAGQKRSMAELSQMAKKAMRDYGIVFVDTATSGGLTLRAEPGMLALMDSTFNRSTFVRNLPWSSMQRIAVGSDAAYTPTSGGGGGSGTAPVFGTIGTVLAVSNPSSPQSVAAPASIANGDLLVAAIKIAGPNAITVTPPAGWTEVGTGVTNTGGTGTAGELHVFYKIASGESGSYSFSWTGGTATGISGRIERFTGVAGTSPLDGSPVTLSPTFSSSFTLGATTPSTANAIRIVILSADAGSPSATGSLTARSGTSGLLFADRALSTSGVSSGTDGITWSTSTVAIGMAMMFKAA